METGSRGFYKALLGADAPGSGDKQLRAR